MRHLDLFSGIGGFALAVDAVWPNSEHIFCDNNNFCQQVLRKHWPNSKIYGDIRYITNADGWGQKEQEQQATRNKQCNRTIDILTGGFPCQPFSQAGKRRGQEDDRYLWPEMLRVIRLVRPRWVVAENVRGLLTIEGGLVFEQVCVDLENENYEVQPFIILAVAVNAPHRRDRIWFIAHAISDSANRKKKSGKLSEAPNKQKQNGSQYGPARQSLRATLGWGSNRSEEDVIVAGAFGHAESPRQPSGDERSGKTQYGRAGSGSHQRSASHAESKRGRGGAGKERRVEEWAMEQDEPKGREIRSKGERCAGSIAYATSGQPWEQAKQKGWKDFERRDWERSWIEVAASTCDVRVDDGLPEGLDFAGWTKARHRVERLKALGNAIVPQVAIEIMKAIKESDVVDNCH